MREFIVALTLSISLLLLPGCSKNDDGGTTGGSGQLMGECSPVASVRASTASLLPNGELEGLTLAVNPDCSYSLRRDSGGVIYGEIVPNPPRWDSTVKTNWCSLGYMQFDLYSGGIRINQCHGEPYDN